MYIVLTEEERKEEAIIFAQYEPRLKELASLSSGKDIGEERRRLVLEHMALAEELQGELNRFFDRIQRERFRQIEKSGADAILANAKEQTAIMLKQMHQMEAEDIEKTNTPASEVQASGIGKLKRGQFYLNADYATEWLKSELRLHIAALDGDKKRLQELFHIIAEEVTASPLTVTEKKVDLTGVKFAPVSMLPGNVIYKANMPMYHGTLTDAFFQLEEVTTGLNRKSDRTVFQTEENEDLKITVFDFGKMNVEVGVNAHKLLCTALAELTRVNNYGSGEPVYRVVIPCDEYIEKLGKTTPEAQKQEKKRLRQIARLFLAMNITLRDTIRKQDVVFDAMSIFDRVQIANGYITLEFGRTITEQYLRKLPITQFPAGLLRIPATNQHAYWIGFKMAEHYNMDNNLISGNANRLKVSTLLSATNIATIEDLQAENDIRHWERRIKEPFEAALDVLTGKVISNWEYVKPKGVPLTDEEAESISDYETFADTLVQFTLIDPPDHKERLARREEEKKKAAERREKKEKQAGKTGGKTRKKRENT